MAWSIFKDTDRPVEQWECCYAAWYVDNDMDTDYYPNRVKFMHEGYVDVYYGNEYVTCKVTGGQWEPDTESKILALVAKTYWGIYIEGFRKIDGRIEVVIGS